MDFTNHIVNRKETPQIKKVPGVEKQRRNNAGGISFLLDKWDYLKRFLIIGTEGGTFYVGQKELTDKGISNVKACLKEDGKRTVDIIVEISQQGRAADNDFAIFALALASAHKDKGTRLYALSNMHKVCRIGTHLFHFIKYVKSFRGTGRALREALSNWYTKKPIEQLAYQMLKYQSRDGWSHRDVIRLAHPVPTDDGMNKLFAYATGNTSIIPDVSMYANGARRIKLLDDPKDAAELIKSHSLTREVVPTEFLKSTEVWEALFEKMPMMATIRNLGKMSSMGMHGPFSEIVKETCDRLTTKEAVQKSRIHPLGVMNALLTYKRGCGVRGKLSWNVNSKILDALEECFYMSFDNVVPTNKRILLALDVSGSMSQYYISGGLMSCRVASGVLAMTTIRTEENVETIGFTSGGIGRTFSVQSGGHGWFRSRSDITNLNLTKRSNFDQVIANISGLPFGGTDCAMPMIYCESNNIDVDAIVIYTDNDTWSGNIHPWQALDKLEQQLGHSVKCIVVGMTGDKFTIARPEYSNMLDVVGMDTSTPAIISDFIR